MAAHVEVEEIQTTKSEKTLALVLAVFLFIGGIWAYARVDDSARSAVAVPAPSPSDEAALARAEAARERLFPATERERVALEELTFSREAWRTALDANRDAPRLERAYGEARAAHAEAERALTAAQAELAAVEPAATAAGDRIAQAQERARERQALIAFTLAAFAALQRYLVRRLPLARVRKGECPFCGYLVRGGAHCEGCGREVVAECGACARARRVGTLHCGACGRA